MAPPRASAVAVPPVALASGPALAVVNCAVDTTVATYWLPSKLASETPSMVRRVPLLNWCGAEVVNVATPPVLLAEAMIRWCGLAAEALVR